MSDVPLELRLAELERRVDHLYDALEVAPPPTGQASLSAEVVALVQQGDLIAAIKQHRLETGASLAEAKAAVEAYGG